MTETNATLSKTTKHGNYLKNLVENEPTITLSLGNSKLSHDILIWNIPAITTCPNCSQCKDTCYARGPEIRYPRVLPCRTSNYEASKLDSFVVRMVELIDVAVSKWGVKAVRIHESGDFYSKEYASKWAVISYRILFSGADVKFFAYTKSPYRPSSGLINIVESILPDGSINYGPHKEIIAKAKKFRCKVCPYGLAKTTLTCGVECKICQTHQNVVFVQH